MLNTLSRAAVPFLAALTFQTQAEVMPISDPAAAEFFQEHLSGVFALPDRYVGGRVIKDGMLRVDYHPNIGLAMAQNATAFPFTVQTVDTVNSSANMIDKRGQLVTFRAYYGHGTLTFSDGYTQHMNHVRPLAEQDYDVLRQALVKGGLANVVEEDPTDDEQGIHEPAQQIQQAGPSFDCEKASTAIEGMICGNGELASLDARAAKAYKLVRDGADDRAAMQREQVQWIKQTRNACKSVECLILAYSERAEDLEQVARYLSKPAAFR